MSYMHRSLRHAVLNTSSKVVIVEGARAVGKTSMARNEFVPTGYSYYTLADESTYELAKTDPGFWVESINHPAIIDEAQRVQGLTLALKEYVDQQEEPGIYFILTGSASIGKAGLDGQDPLTRRSQRFTLSPLTQREIIGNSSNLVDDLWKGDWNTRFESDLSAEQLAMQLKIGGFPYYVDESLAGQVNDIGNQVRSDLKSILGDTLLPDERLDQIIANAILKRLLCLPGDILNMSSVGKAVNCDNRTVERYMSIFDNRFLIRCLPNLKQMPQKQIFTRAKIHPVDVSFSVEALRESGVDPLEDRSFFGKILESYVVAQVVPDAQWANHRATSYYWREAGREPREVDLVLCHNNELIGIEVKAATSFSLDDFEGLRALGKDSRFRFGYLVYTGQKIVRVSEKLWAIPLDALWSPLAANRERIKNANQEIIKVQEGAQPEQEPMAVVANVFLSYYHADNAHLDNAMVILAEEIAKEYEFQFGMELKIYFDREFLKGKNDEQVEIDRTIGKPQVFIPCITPRYLQSEACREVFMQFLKTAKRNNQCRILSLIWQPPNSQQPDQVYDTVQKMQVENVAILRDLSPSDKKYKKVVRHLVAEIHKVIVPETNTPGLRL